MTGEGLTPAELDRLREVCGRIPYVGLLGIEFAGAARGRATCALELRPELTRNGGLMHGGAIASLLDTTAAFAMMTLLAPGQTTVTVNLTVHFLRPVLEGRIQAEARVLRAGRRLATLAVEVMDRSGKLTTTATTTYLIQPLPRP